jgi:GAF domain-containing protein
VFADDDRALLVAFADQAAVALDNARRYAGLEERLRAFSPQG